MKAIRSAVVFLALVLATIPAFAQGGEEVVYFHADAIGSVRLVTDASGAVVERYDYLPFGEPYPPSAPVVETRRFGGKERDAETGLDYFGARSYSSLNGRFTVVDPALDVTKAVERPQLWNRYAYATNNSFRYIDPDGRDTIPTEWQMTHGSDGLILLARYVQGLLNGAMSFNVPGGHLTPEGERVYQAQFFQASTKEEAAFMAAGEWTFLLSPLIRMPGRASALEAGALRSVGSIDDVIAAPSVLRGGVTPEQLMNRLGSLPETWRVEGLGKGGEKGQGFVLREYKLGPKRTEPTGRMIRWHPGGGHHGEIPYWKVVDYDGPSGEIR